MEMTVADVKQFIEANKENDDVKGLLGSYNQPTLDGVKKFLETDDSGKKHLQSVIDAAVGTGIETWKKNNLDKEREAYYKERSAKEHPEETPEQKRIRELEERVAQSDKARTLSELRAGALSILSQEKLEPELIDFVMAEDADKTKAKIDRIKSIIEKRIAGEVETRMKAGGREPQKTTAADDATLQKQLEEANKAGKTLDIVRLTNQIHAQKNRS